MKEREDGEWVNGWEEGERGCEGRGRKGERRWKD